MMAWLETRCFQRKRAKGFCSHSIAARNVASMQEGYKVPKCGRAASAATKSRKITPGRHKPVYGSKKHSRELIASDTTNPYHRTTSRSPASRTQASTHSSYPDPELLARGPYRLDRCVSMPGLASYLSSETSLQLLRNDLQTAATIGQQQPGLIPYRGYQRQHLQGIISRFGKP